MKRSAFLKKDFARFWNELSGSKGQAYKQYVVDPLMFKLIGSLKGKCVFDLGCGNGYLGPNYVRKGAKSVTLADISPHNLEAARSKCLSPKISFLQLDATKVWDVRSSSLDLIYSDMMLNEVEDIRTPISEAYRSLKKGGEFCFAVTHPSWDLFEFAKAKAGQKSKVLSHTHGYFWRGYTKFILSGPSLASKQIEQYEVEHYQRPLQDYFDVLFKNGFKVKAVKEPPVSKSLLKAQPAYKNLKDFPISLVILAEK